jgi:disulfide bond formation protein DsbB
LVAGTGAVVAAYHSWLQTLPAEEATICLPPLDYLLTNFTLSETVHLLLYSPGQCGTVDWVFLGLDIPAWALLIFLALGVMGAGCNRLRKKSPLPYHLIEVKDRQKYGQHNG